MLRALQQAVPLRAWRRPRPWLLQLLRMLASRVDLLACLTLVPAPPRLGWRGRLQGALLLWDRRGQRRTAPMDLTQVFLDFASQGGFQPG